MSYERLIGGRYLRTKTKRPISVISAIAITGVALGVASLLVVTSVISGFKDEVTKKIIGVNAHIIIRKYGRPFAEYKKVMAKAEKLKGVKGVSPFLYQPMMISKGERTGGVMIKGVDPDRIGDVLDLPKHLVAGGLTGLRVPGCEAGGIVNTEFEGEMPGIVLGQTLAENLTASVGDVVRVTMPTEGLSMLKGYSESDTLKTAEFVVVGLFYAGFVEYDTNFAYVDYFQAQRFAGQGDAVLGVELTLHDYTDAPEISKAVWDMVDGPPYHIVDWATLNEPTFAWISQMKIVLMLVIALLVGVAAFNIIATLVMLVFDKRRDIAILKSMGATRWGIAALFLHVGNVIGALGISIGLALGLGMCLLLVEVGWPLDPKIYLIDHLPARIEAIDFVLTAVVAYILCLVATLVPSLSAARLHPVDGIRHQ